MKTTTEELAKMWVTVWHGIFSRKAAKSAKEEEAKKLTADERRFLQINLLVCGNGSGRWSGQDCIPTRSVGTRGKAASASL